MKKNQKIHKIYFTKILRFLSTVYLVSLPRKSSEVKYYIYKYFTSLHFGDTK
jgi:hypothetical protein